MDLALEVGVDDVVTGEEAHELYTAMEDFIAVGEELERRGVPVLAKELAMIPQTYVAVPANQVKGLMRLLDALEDHDDVQHVWANFETAEA
jgi:transcriptional/translational regulatory protein YebC/TACO1